MKKYRIQNVSGSALLVMLVVTIIILGMFFLGGETPVDQRVVADTSLSEPLYTETLIYWIYVLFGIAVGVTLISMCYQLIEGFKNSPKDTLKSMLGFVCLVAIMVISWVAGSTEALVMPGYEGTENVPFWLKLTDMFLYTIYALMGIMIVLIIGFGFARKFK